MTATNKPMTGAQLDELVAVAMRMQSDSEKMGESSVSMFAYAVQVAVLEILENRCKYEELQSQNADMAVQLANAESKCRDLAAENENARNAVQVFCDVVGANTDAICEEVGRDGVRAILAAMNATGNMPATDAFLAEVRAQGVDAAIEHLSKKFKSTGHIGIPAMALEWLAQEIRKGAAL
ncbi:hypothetical protein [Citrobacter werkmanii]|uniref:hypothetical protein n=1 Tax=Citrobacter werkmanii TaxID=67827 RepID=UPI0034D6D571